MIISPAAHSPCSFSSPFSLPRHVLCVPILPQPSPPLLAFCSPSLSPSLLQGWIIPVSACLVTFGPRARLSRPHHTAMALAGLTSRRRATGFWCPWRWRWPVPHCKALTSSKLRHVSAPGLLIAKYGMSIHVIFRLKDERDMRIFMSSSFFFFSSPFLFLLSKTCTNWLQIFRPFHVVRIPPSPHLVFFGCCRLEGPHQHYSLQSCPSQES